MRGISGKVRAGAAAGIATAVLLTALAGCGTETARIDFGAKPQASITLSPEEDAKSGRTDKPVTVKAANGKIVGITVTDDIGRVLPGEVAGGSTWQSKGKVAPNVTYKVEALVRGTNGITSNFVRTTHTAMPKKRLVADVTQGSDTVGVGMPFVVNFATPVRNKAEVERRMVVESNKPVPEGAWHWFDDKEVHYRPRSYWPGNTDVYLKMKLRGIDSGNGAWGDRDRTYKMHVGRSVVTKVNLFEHYATTYIDGQRVKSMPVTGGKPGWRTRNGIKLVLDKEYGKTFTNEMIAAAENYRLYSRYAIRTTWTGEFVHSAPWSVGSQGWSNTSHGCVGMSTGNSGWLFRRSKVGDPIEVRSSGSDYEVRGNGYGDWNLSWSDWKRGSALRDLPKEPVTSQVSAEPAPLPERLRGRPGVEN